MSKVHPNRVRSLNTHPEQDGVVVYWMQRDQRAEDNWALLYAQNLAITKNQPLIVVFNVVPKFLDATIRQYGFMLRGLAEVAEKLEQKHIPFVLLEGDAVENLPHFVKKHKAGALITDFSPLKIVRGWKHKIARQVLCAFYEVDAHNVVPVWVASPKQEFGAYTIRPKIHKLLPEYLTDLPKLKNHPAKTKLEHKPFNLNKVFKSLEVNEEVAEVDWLTPGEKGAHKVFQRFLHKRFKAYATQRNDPNVEAQSELSPYFHFGQISAQRVAYEVSLMPASESRESYLEELIIRRELSDNFCFYNEHYDSFEGFPEWGKKTLNEHRRDTREYMYSYKQLESAKTHDDLWNAAQKEMVVTGKMHNYMRMYWAKKILEWTPDPETAFKYALKLNDTYELDGRDPNGYVGCAWSIGGLHDRAWGERPVFGKIRYMSYGGAKGKFDIKSYIARIDQLVGKTLI